MSKFSKKKYKLFLYIPDIIEIFVNFIHKYHQIIHKF